VKSLRLLPIMMLAAGGLLVLKGAGLVLSGSYTLGGVTPALAQTTSAIPKADEAKAAEAGTGDKVGLTKTANDASPREPEVNPKQKVREVDGTVIKDENNSLVFGSRSRQAVLERLGERRKRLDTRESEIDLREQLLAATEKRIQSRVEELKTLEARIDTVAKEKKERESQKMSGLVKMYESMKPKDAARIFDRLNMKVLVGVVKLIKPRKMAGILGRMAPDAAERLTIALASGDAPPPPAESKMLPKIVSDSGQ